MVRKSKQSDNKAIVKIWLAASIQAHDFMPPEYWESKADDMLNIYIPVSDTYVYETKGAIAGFLSLHESRIAALFVSPNLQGQGIGSKLLEFGKTINNDLSLCVYKCNTKSISFYKTHGFKAVGEQVDVHTNYPEIMMKMSLKYVT